MTQVYLSGHGEPRSVEMRSDDETSSSFEAAVERLDDESARDTPFSPLSRGVGGTELPFVALLKSNAVPGVFGVFVDDPNEAKAPDPRPNADEADGPDVGDAIPEVLRGEIALKGFRDPSAPPKRFELEKRREEG